MLGDPRMPDRFWRKIRVEGSCWAWTASECWAYKSLPVYAPETPVLDEGSLPLWET